MSKVRVRFAPSPTGLLHIGSARTALFNWLYARHTGGTFVLRIEDTDAARNSQEAVDVIFSGLKWLGLDWDEGPMPDGSVVGEFGPYFQSQRREICQKYVEKLLSEGKAYATEDGAVKFKMPRGEIIVPDLICGDTHFDTSNPALSPDLVIQRKDGSPVFHLINVVDDLEMQITHVIRGEDHLSNTPKHLALFKAIGAEPPRYAHIPLILNPNGSKMSKRDKGAAVGDYINEGYLSSALVNYLCLLGWSPKDNREIITIKEVIEKFDLPQVNRANARFDVNKLFWINGEYFHALSLDELETFATPILTKAGMLPEGFDRTYLRAALTIVKEKIKLGRELPEWLSAFFTEDFPIDEAAVKKNFTEDGLKNLALIRERISEVTPFDVASLETIYKATAEAKAVKLGAFVHPTRLAVSGRTVGPSLYHMLEVLGRERVLKRIDAALAKFAA